MALQKFAVETGQTEGEITFEANAVHAFDCDICFIIPQNSIYIFAHGVARIDLVISSSGNIVAWLLGKLDHTLTLSPDDTTKTIWANPEMLRKAVR
jgi:hypothetical protein